MCDLTLSGILIEIPICGLLHWMKQWHRSWIWRFLQRPSNLIAPRKAPAPCQERCTLVLCQIPMVKYRLSHHSVHLQPFEAPYFSSPSSWQQPGCSSYQDHLEGGGELGGEKLLSSYDDCWRKGECSPWKVAKAGKLSDLQFTEPVARSALVSLIKMSSTWKFTHITGDL